MTSECVEAVVPGRANCLPQCFVKFYWEENMRMKATGGKCNSRWMRRRLRQQPQLSFGYSLQIGMIIVVSILFTTTVTANTNLGKFPIHFGFVSCRELLNSSWSAL
ncbi:hypothetical protein CHUAL_011115 [Chamberlinius hualienensis]